MKNYITKLLAVVSVLSLSLFALGCSKKSVDYQGYSKPPVEQESRTNLNWDNNSSSFIITE